MTGASTSSVRSAFVSTKIGRAPLSQASVGYRSRRRTLRSSFSEVTINTVSTLAARTLLLEHLLQFARPGGAGARRGSYRPVARGALPVATPFAGWRKVGGLRPVVEALGDVAPELAELGEHVVGAAMLHGDAAGIRPAFAWGSNCSARASSQPSAVSLTRVMVSSRTT